MDNRSQLLDLRYLLGVGSLRLHLVAGMMFILAAANGIPQIWNSAYPALLMSLALASIHVTMAKNPFEINARFGLTDFLYLAWIAAASASWIAHPQIESTSTFFYAYLVPAAIFLALRFQGVSAQENTMALAALALGALLPSIAGAAAYYWVWGIPSLPELALNRYDRIYMEPYQIATFGNIGHMAAYACLIGPPMLTGALSGNLRRWLRWLCFGAYLALLLNVLIVQSRAGILVFGLVTLAILIAFKYYKTLAATAFLAFGLVGKVGGEEGWDLYLSRLVSAATIDDASDTSIAERLDSMSHSWAIFLREPLLGAGPGLSRLGNPFAVAHQFFVHQAAELGVTGLLVTIALAIVVPARLLMAAVSYRRAGTCWPELLWLSGAAGWLAYSSVAGATLNITFVIPWAGLFAAFLALSNVREAPRRP